MEVLRMSMTRYVVGIDVMIERCFYFQFGLVNDDQLGICAPRADISPECLFQAQCKKTKHRVHRYGLSRMA